MDAYGNITHTLTLNRPHTDIRAARGRTGCGERARARRALGGEDSRLPVHAYCVQTALTQADETILAFTRHALPDGLNTPDDALALARAPSATA